MTQLPAGSEVSRSPDPFVTPRVSEVSVVRQPVVEAGTATTVALESHTPRAFLTRTRTGASRVVVVPEAPGATTTAAERVPPAVAGSDWEHVPAQTEYPSGKGHSVGIVVVAPEEASRRVPVG
jgi:hypothetical protein